MFYRCAGCGRNERQRGLHLLWQRQLRQAASAAQQMRARAARIRRLSVVAPRDARSLLSLCFSYRHLGSRRLSRRLQYLLLLGVQELAYGEEAAAVQRLLILVKLLHALAATYHSLLVAL